MKRTELRRRTPLARRRARPRRQHSERCRWTFSRCRAIYLPVILPEGRYCTPHGNAMADALFASLVRRRDGACFNCGAAETLEAAHLVTRGARYIRWDPDNAIALCHRCHATYTDHPETWRRFIEAIWPGRVVRLYHREIAGESTGMSLDVAAIIIDLREQMVA